MIWIKVKQVSVHKQLKFFFSCIIFQGCETTHQQRHYSVQRGNFGFLDPCLEVFKPKLVWSKGSKFIPFEDTHLNIMGKPYHAMKNPNKNSLIEVMIKKHFQYQNCPPTFYISHFSFKDPCLQISKLLKLKIVGIM